MADRIWEDMWGGGLSCYEHKLYFGPLFNSAERSCFESRGRSALISFIMDLCEMRPFQLHLDLVNGSSLSSYVHLNYSHYFLLFFIFSTTDFLSLSCYFSTPALTSAISPQSSDFKGKMVFRNQTLDAMCTHYSQWAIAFRLSQQTELGTLYVYIHMHTFHYFQPYSYICLYWNHEVVVIPLILCKHHRVYFSFLPFHFMWLKSPERNFTVIIFKVFTQYTLYIASLLATMAKSSAPDMSVFRVGVLAKS